MFTLLRFKIALFFAAAAFGLLVLQGIIFLSVELRSDIERIDATLSERAQNMVLALETVTEEGSEAALNSRERDTTRLYDADGNIVFTGLIYQNTASELRREPWTLQHGSLHYRVLTFPIYSNGDITGYVQMGMPVRTFMARLQQLLLPLTALSLLLSIFVFIMGMFYEKRVMKPTAEAMENMSIFAQNAGHELRTPLANMQSSLDIAMKSQNYREAVEEMRVDLRKMTDLINKLLELESLRKSKLEQAPVDVSSLAENAASSFHSALQQKGIELVRDITPGVVRLGDEDLLRTAVTNLIQNASKFTEAGGTITVTVTHSYLSVADTGVGMAPAVSEKIFDKFFKADVARSNEGFGLGLALVKRIAELHNWQVLLVSSPGKGSTFTLRFSSRQE